MRVSTNLSGTFDNVNKDVTISFKDNFRKPLHETTCNDIHSALHSASIGDDI